MEKAPYLKEEETVVPHHKNPADSLEKDYCDLIDLAVHDLDAPLRKLTLLVGMLTGKLTKDKELQSYNERIVGCIEDMRSLIDDLSVLGKLETTEKEITACNIDSILQEALQMLPPVVKEKHALVTSYSLPVIEGDRFQYRLLFKKLLENSITFHKKDRAPEIHIESAILTAEEKRQLDLNDERLYYKIEVTDQGIGFKSEHADKIFQPFVRLHGKSQFPGNGIGLAICRKITAIHRGIIYAEGGENEGAKFILILPESH